MELDLGKGRIALIDDEDWTRVRKHTSRKGVCTEAAPCHLRWFVNRNGYMQSGGSNGRPRVLLHRLLTECPEFLVVDHINGKKLDNRQCNLRACHNDKNIANRRKRCKSNCVYKGVVRNWYPLPAKQYRAQLGIGNRKVRSVYFATQLEAALAYDDIAVRIHGEFACLNFPERHRARASNIHAA